MQPIDKSKRNTWLLRAVIPMAILLLVTVVSLKWSEQKTVEGASTTAKQFFNLLAGGQYNQAENLSTGLEKYQVSKNATLFSAVGRAVMVSFDSQLIAASKDYVQLETRVVSQSQGHYDVQWYDVAVIMDNGFWLVLNVQYAQPWHDIPVGYGRLSDSDQKDISLAFDHYRWDVEQGNYQDSLRYLSGQAKLSQEQSQSILSLGKGKGGVYQPRQVKLKVLWSGGSLVVAHVGYEFGDRAVQAVVTFYKLPDGWKIVNMVQN